MTHHSAPDQLVAYETGTKLEGADATVVTASEPFSGYLYTQPGFSLSGLDPTGAMGTQFVNTAILYWAFDEALPGRPLGGAITGRVLRVTWNPGSSGPDYEPVAGALVSGVDVTGEPLWATARPGESAGPNVAVSQADGTYALIDLHYQGGPVTIAARIEGETKTATAYQANPQDLKSPGLQFVRHAAVADITFPAVAPPPQPSQITVTLLVQEAEGRWAPSTGVVVAGTPVLIGATAATDLKILGAEIAGGGLTATPFAVRPRNDTDPPGVAAIIDPNFVPPQPGTYTVTVFAQPAFGGEVRTTVTFRAVAVAGGSLDPIAPDPPAVITARLVPKPNATGVSVSVYPQIAFTEPVKNVLGQVTLTDDTGAEVPIVLLGAGPDGPVDNVTAETLVTSLTLQPLTGLQYATRYTLRLTDQIVDLDAHPTTGEPDPHHLVAFESSFTTFDPVSLGATEEQFTAGGLAIMNDRAYVAENRGRTTAVRLYDVSDPVQPLEITGPPTENFALVVPPPVLFPGHPADLVAEENSPLTGGPVIAVATTNLTYPYQPSNVRLYDVSDDQTWRWIGAVTLGTSPVDGQIQRIVLRGELLYAVTAGVAKGIQVVDLAKAREIFDAQTANGEADPMFWEMQQRLGLEGQGFAQPAIVQTIFLDTGTGQMSLQRDLAVIDLNVDGITQPIVVATGRTPLSVVNPQTGEMLYKGPICAEDAAVCDAAQALTSWGWTIAAGVVQGRPLAFVTSAAPAGAADTMNRLVVIDLADVRNPRALGALTFSGNPAGQGLVLQGEQVFVGTDAGTTIVSLADLMHLRIAGSMAHVGGRLAFADANVLFGTVRSPSTDNPLGGIRNAALGSMLLIERVHPRIVSVADDGTPGSGITITYRAISPPASLTTGRVVFAKDGLVEAAFDVPISGPGSHSITIDRAAVRLAVPPSELRLQLVQADGGLGPVQRQPIVRAKKTAAAIEGQIVPPAYFETVSPAVIAGPATAADLKVSGRAISRATMVYVRTPDGEWHAIRPVSWTTTTLTLRLTAALLTVDGFLLVAPEPDDRIALSVLRLQMPSATLGTYQAAITAIAHVDETDVTPPENLASALAGRRVIGHGFEPGVTVMLGQAGVAGIPLLSQYLSEEELEIELPPLPLGNTGDMFLAVRSPDGATLSGPFGVESRPLEVISAGPGGSGDLVAGIASIRGAVLWDSQDQTLFVEGEGLTPGMEVEFSNDRGLRERVALSASTVPVASAPTRTWLSVNPPNAMISYPRFTFTIAPVEAEGVAPGTPRAVVAQTPPGSHLVRGCDSLRTENGCPMGDSPCTYCLSPTQSSVRPSPRTRGSASRL